MNGISQLHYWFSKVLPVQHPATRIYPYNQTQESNKNIILDWKKLDFTSLNSTTNLRIYF